MRNIDVAELIKREAGKSIYISRTHKNDEDFLTHVMDDVITMLDSADLTISQAIDVAVSLEETGNQKFIDFFVFNIGSIGGNTRSGIRKIDIYNDYIKIVLVSGPIWKMYPDENRLECELPNIEEETQ